MLKKIETERLILRKPKRSDLIDFFNYAKKETIGYLAGWLPHESINHTKIILNDFIKKQNTWAITIKPSDTMVGSIALTLRTFEEAMLGIAELGYAIDDIYWNKGYITEASKAVIEFGFKNYDLNKIIAGHSVENIGSKRVIEKSGFKFTHIDDSRVFQYDKIKEVYMYELNKNEIEGL